MEFKICIPGQEKAWKLDKFVWVTEFQIFSKHVLADVEKERNLVNFVSSIKTIHSASGLLWLVILRSWNWIKSDGESHGIVFPNFCVNSALYCSG